MVGRSDAALDRARDAHRAELALLSARGLVGKKTDRDVLGKISLTLEVDGIETSATPIVFEAINEDLPAKRDIYRKVETKFGSSCIICSCTSGLAAASLFSELEFPGRAIVTHFANPPTLMPLVEVVKAPRTSDTTVERVRSLLDALGKRTALLGMDLPGHIFNRIQFAMLREAIALVRSGAVDPSDLDVIVTQGLALRLSAEGPIAKMDLAGLELVAVVADYLFPSLDRSQSADALSELIASGRTGALSGAGFLEWTEKQRAEMIERRAERVLDVLKLQDNLPNFDGNDDVSCAN